MEPSKLLEGPISFICSNYKDFESLLFYLEQKDLVMNSGLKPSDTLILAYIVENKEEVNQKWGLLYINKENKIMYSTPLFSTTRAESRVTDYVNYNVNERYLNNAYFVNSSSIITPPVITEKVNREWITSKYKEE